MQKIVIRPAIDNDFDSLTQLAAELQDYEKAIYPLRKSGASYGTESAKRMLVEIKTGESDVFVAEVNGQVVGYIAAHSEHNDCDQNDTYYVEDLAVTETFRSQGIGTQLLKYTEEFAKTKGFKKFGVGILIANDRVLKYYEKYGFEVYGVELNKDIAWIKKKELILTSIKYYVIL